MANKILLIARNTKAHLIRRLVGELEKNNKKYDIVRWSKLVFYQDGIYDGEKPISVSEYKSVFFQAPIYYTVKNKNKRFVVKLNNELFLLAKFFKKYGVKIINEKVIMEQPYYDKFNQSVMFLQKNIPTIPTLHLTDNEDDRVFTALNMAKINFPLVVKESIGGVGDDVYKFNKKQELEKFLKDKRNHNLIYQPFIKNNCDYRIIVCGGKSLGVMKRIAGKKMWKNNFSLGAHIEKHIEPKMEKFAESACQKIGFDYAGVDVLKVGDKYLVIEINMIPNFKGFEKAHSDMNVAEKIIEILLKK